MNSPNRKIVNIDDVTPVDYVDDIYLKREDLFMPYEDIPINGSKLREIIAYIDDKKEIISKNGGLIICNDDQSSSRGLMIARVIRDNYKDFKLITFRPEVNHNCDRLTENILLQGSHVTSQNVNEAISAWKDRSDAPKFFNLKLKENIQSYEEPVFGLFRKQVKNLPNNLDYLIVPCGSTITLAGILSALYFENIKIGKVIGISSDNNDMHEVANSILKDIPCSYEYYVINNIDRNIPVNMNIGNVKLDPYYEAKAWKYVLDNLRQKISGKKVCFWITGNTIDIRSKVYKSPIESGQMIHLLF